jgi:hypothetical protein
VKEDGRKPTVVRQSPPKVKTADNRHDRGHNHKYVAGDRNAGEKWPSLENVSEHGACEHSWPKGKEKRVEHPKEDESPFDLSEDGPPALYDMISKAREGMGKGHTDITHGAKIWNAIVSLVESVTNPGTMTYHSEDKERGLIRPDVPIEGSDQITRKEIDPHPNRQKGEKCCQLQECGECQSDLWTEGRLGKDSQPGVPTTSPCTSC